MLNIKQFLDPTVSTERLLKSTPQSVKAYALKIGIKPELIDPISDNLSGVLRLIEILVDKLIDHI